MGVRVCERRRVLKGGAWGISGYFGKRGLCVCVIGTIIDHHTKGMVSDQHEFDL